MGHVNTYNSGLMEIYGMNRSFPNTVTSITFKFCMWLSRQHKSEGEWCQTSRQWFVVSVPYTKADMMIMCDYLEVDVGKCQREFKEVRDEAIKQIFGEKEQVALEMPSPIVDLGTPDVPGCAPSCFTPSRTSSWNEGFGNKGLVKIAEPRLRDS